MAAHIIKDAELRLGGRDITGLLNNVAMEYSADLQEDTVLGDDTRSRLSGLASAGITINGFWDGAADADFFSEIAAASPEVLSVLANGAAEADRAFTAQVLGATYTPGAAIGEVFPFTFETQSSGPLVRGVVGGIGVKLVDGNTAAGINLGALPTGSKLYVALHVLANGGNGSQTLDVTVVSDDNNNFGSGQSTRITFAQVTTVNAAQWLSVSGAITDPYWRVEWVIGGDSASSPTFTILVVLGITNL